MQTVKVFIACVLGAFVGSLLGLHFGHLWISILSGGAVGYFSFEAPALIAAVPVAWNRTLHRYEALEIMPKLRRCSRAFIMALGELFNLNLLSFPGWTMVFIGEYRKHGSFSSHENLLPLLLVSLIMGFFLLVNFVVLLNDDAVKECQRNRLHIPFVGFFQVAKGGWRKRKVIGHSALALATFFGRLAKQWFILIHSDIRLLCMADAALGAMVGYCFHNVLVGAVIGGVSGVVNYEVFSVRVLSLVPSTESVFKRFS